MTEEQVLAHNAKHAKIDSAPDVADDGAEKELMNKIIEDLKRDGGMPMHDKSRRKNRKGEFLDIICPMPGGVTLWIETKSAWGKLSPEQIDTIKKLKARGHFVIVTHNFKQYLREKTKWLSLAKNL